MNSSIITEQCGARWRVEPTGAIGARAYWVRLDFGQSMARPGILGFYASSINAAAANLNN
jgi:hypothetical protein